MNCNANATTTTHCVEGEKLQSVITKILESSTRLPGAVPVPPSTGETCNICHPSRGIASNSNGLLRTRFCNKYYSVHSLLFYAEHLNDGWKHLSKKKQLELFLTMKDSNIDCEISHLCDTPNCVEPSHLVLESRSSSMKRKGCPGYAICKDTLLQLCKHEPPCLKVTDAVDTSYDTQDLESFRVFCDARLLYRTTLANEIANSKAQVLKKAVFARSNIASSKEQKKEKRQRKKAEKRKLRRKERKEMKRQKL